VYSRQQTAIYIGNLLKPADKAKQKPKSKVLKILKKTKPTVPKQKNMFSSKRNSASCSACQPEHTSLKYDALRSSMTTEKFHSKRKSTFKYDLSPYIDKKYKATTKVVKNNLTGQ
jgi:hypothetical protein